MLHLIYIYLRHCKTVNKAIFRFAILDENEIRLSQHARVYLYVKSHSMVILKAVCPSSLTQFRSLYALIFRSLDVLHSSCYDFSYFLSFCSTHTRAQRLLKLKKASSELK